MIWIDIDRNKSESLSRQLYSGLTGKIIDGELPADFRLPSTRTFAKNLGIARNIVIDVYEQLVAEGYLHSKPGSGTFVSEGAKFIKDFKDTADDGHKKQTPPKHLEWKESEDLIHFSSMMPDLSHFPQKKWAAIMRDVYFTQQDIFDYPNPLGVYDLRVAISNHLFKTKGLRCLPEQIVVTQGSIHAFKIVNSLLKDQIKKTIVEDPSYDVIRNFFKKETDIIPIPVDKQGMKVADLPKDFHPKFICITPSHQYPMGSILSIQRRIELVSYAESTKSYIIENDYGGELSISEMPVRSCFTINPERVFHIGTFSKSLYPSLRIGYLVIPKKFLDYDLYPHVSSELGTSSLDQYILSRFINENHYVRYINKMRRIYDAKRKLILNYLDETFGQSIEIYPCGPDYYLSIGFNGVCFSGKEFNKMANFGIMTHRVEDWSLLKGNHQHELILSFGSLSNDQIISGINALKKFINHLKLNNN